MRKLFLISGLLLPLFCLGCGSNGGFHTPTGAGTGTFSNASLNGQYVYQISGFDLSSGSAVPYREAGVFMADGAGNITSGADDFCEGSACSSANPVNGSYTVANDGTGSLSLSFGINLALTLASPSKVYLMETDSANASGVAELQNPSVLSLTPSGTFAFRMHTISSAQGSSSVVGAITIASGVVSGNEDVERGGVFDNAGSSPLTLTGSFTAPASNGRGTGSITDSSNVTSDFIYYIVDANNVRWLSTDSGILGLGRGEKQTGGPFSAASLSGGYAFGSRADDNTYLGGVNTVGSFSSAGAGAITAGAFDSVQDGNSLVDVSFTGSYTMASDGRAAVTLNPSGEAAVQQVFWMVNKTRAFLITNDPTKVEDGTLDQQQGTFSNTSLNGQYAFVMDGFDLNSGFYVDRIGWIQWSGSGNLTWNEVVNDSGVPQQPPFLSGTYTVGSSGRATASVNNLSSNVVLYLVSGSNAYVLQNDAGVEIIGAMSLQSQ
jgi:hypothetical protein